MGNRNNTGKTADSKRNAPKRRNAGKKADSVQEMNFRDEAILLAVLAVNLVLFLGNFGLAGGVDTGANWISNRLKGLFGLMEYVFPLIVIGTVYCCMKHKGNRKVHRKTVVTYLFMFLAGAFVQLLRGNQFDNLFQQGMNHVFSGGLLCGSIASFLHSFLDFFGSFAVLAILMIGCIVYLTEVSFVGGVEKRSRKVYETTREDVKRHREESRIRKEEQQEQQARRRENMQMQREENARIRQEEAEKERQKRAKIARQMEYMEKDRLEREARAKQYEKKQYENVNGMSIVTLEQPRKSKKTVDEAQKDVHEVFVDDSAATVSSNGNKSNKKSTSGSFTIRRAGGISDVTIEDGKPARIESRTPVTQSGQDEAGTDVVSAAKSVSEEITAQNEKQYVKPDISLLRKSTSEDMESEESLSRTGMKLQNTLQSFGVRVTVTNISCGPSVTRFELQPEQGVKVSKIVGLADDIKLNLAVENIRIEAPIPGKAAVGIEVPNKKASPVLLGDILDSDAFKNSKSSLSFAVGKDIGGEIVVHDVAKMPHLLIAGATGSGKSVCINTLIMSILYKADPDKVKLIMIDPKVVELSVYNGIPHMFIPVVTDPKKAAGALHWAVTEMTERYQKMAEMGVRDLAGYNAKVEKLPESEERPQPLPQIIIIVDELADLMMVSKNEVEDAICRLAQLARAAGIHLVIATQRPSVDVITGLIKANMPSRIALSVTSGVDSRTIIDINGAEKLLGKGDMLFYPSGYPKPVRVQGAYISDEEVSDVVEALRAGCGEVQYDSAVEERINQVQTADSLNGNGSEENGSLYDDYFIDAGRFVIEKDKASASMIQRMFRVGFNRAARIIDQLEEAGVIGEEEGTKPRNVLMSLEEFEQFVEEYV